MEIIKTSRPVSCALCCVASVALGNSAVSAADVVLQKVPALSAEKAPAYPVNLARYHFGAQIEASPKAQNSTQLQLSSNGADQNKAEAALLCDDPTVGYALPAGTTTLLVSLPQVENLASVSLLNDGAKGTVNVAVANAKQSANSWQTLADQELDGSMLQANIGPAEGKYVRLTFNITAPGRIAGLGIYPTSRISDFTTPRTHQSSLADKSDSVTLVANHLNDIHAKGRALYVSSGADATEANKMIDDQTSTAYTFAAEDGSPTTVIDLGKNAMLRRLSTVYTPRAGTVQFYVLASLPTSNAPDSLKFDDATLKPVGAVTDDGTRGRAAVDFPATAGRYVMVRWIPTGEGQAAFSVSEVAAFGKAGDDKTLLAANTGLTLGQVNEVDGKTMMDGKTVIEPKDRGEAAPQSPAEGPPPPLPQPPPFGFLPVVVPASP